MKRVLRSILAAVTKDITAERHKRHSPQPLKQEPQETAHLAQQDEVEIIKLLISRAEATLAAFNEAADHNDNRSIGLIAIILAGAGFLVSLRDSLQPFWWVPLIGLGATIACFGATFARRFLFDTGPDIGTFYQTWAGADQLSAHRQMLAELVQTLDTSARVVQAKAKTFNAGLASLIATIVLGSAFLLATVKPHSSAIRALKAPVITHVYSLPTRSPTLPVAAWMDLI